MVMTISAAVDNFGNECEGVVVSFHADDPSARLDRPSEEYETLRSAQKTLRQRFGRIRWSKPGMYNVDPRLLRTAQVKI